MGNDQADDCHMTRLLDNVWSAMVLLFGQDELTNIKNLERFKRDIKPLWYTWGITLTVSRHSGSKVYDEMEILKVPSILKQSEEHDTELWTPVSFELKEQCGVFLLS
nr:hypothetical protein BaRGS_022681 [Batillaria attramentaria]